MRRLILNADDYAMDEGVDAAILELIDRKVVTAASVMVLSPRWREAATEIKQANADCGLHLDLTSDFAASKPVAPDLRTLIARAYTRRLDTIAIRGMIELQLDRFEDALGRAPDFVDGHQHVHQLPVVRSQLLGAIHHRYRAEASRIGIRICAPRRWRGAKAHVIGALGSGAMARLSRQSRHSLNSDFLGVYDFSPHADLRALWRRWLTRMQGETPLAMCHVATASAADQTGDPIRSARLQEFAWLASDGFRALCTELLVALARWRRGNGGGA